MVTLEAIIPLWHFKRWLYLVIGGLFSASQAKKFFLTAGTFFCIYRFLGMLAFKTLPAISNNTTMITGIILFIFLSVLYVLYFTTYKGRTKVRTGG
jgi:hypothetical protein